MESLWRKGVTLAFSRGRSEGQATRGRAAHVHPQWYWGSKWFLCKLWSLHVFSELLILFSVPPFKWAPAGSWASWLLPCSEGSEAVTWYHQLIFQGFEYWWGWRLKKWEKQYKTSCCLILVVSETTIYELWGLRFFFWKSSESTGAGLKPCSHKSLDLWWWKLRFVMQLGPISQQIALQALANLKTWLECFGYEEYAIRVYRALQRHEIVFPALMFHLIIAACPSR